MLVQFLDLLELRVRQSLFVDVMQVGDSGPVARLIIAYDTNADETILAFEHVI